MASFSAPICLNRNVQLILEFVEFRSPTFTLSSGRGRPDPSDDRRPAASFHQRECVMHFEPRLWQFTQGVRARIAWAVAIGLISVALGVARLGLLGWLIGQVFAGRPLAELVPSIVVIAGIMVLRGVAEYGRVMVAHETASRVQARLRRSIFDRIAALGPAPCPAAAPAR